MKNTLAIIGSAMLLGSFGMPAPLAAHGDAAEKPDIPDDYPSYAFVCPDGGYESGCDEMTLENAVSLEGADQAAFTTRCLYQTAADCSVISSGRIQRAGIEQVLDWQLLQLQPSDGPAAEMIVLAQVEGDDQQLLISRQVDGYFDPPFVARDGDGRFLLHVPARNRGLGNADILLFTSGHGWNWTTAALVTNQVDRLLPVGFSVASPISFNLREASAFALVRRDDDAGCCATGGVVNIDFEQGDFTLDVAGIGFTETTPVGETLRAGPQGGFAQP